MENTRPGFYRALDAITVVLFIVLIAAPFAGMGFGSGPGAFVDESEKRVPAAPPARPRNVSEALKYADQVDAYVQDHFAFRKTLIRAHSALLYFGLKTSSSPKVVLGKNDWLFYNGERQDGSPIADYRGTEPLTTIQLDWLRAMIQDQYEWLLSRGITYLFVIIPSKEEIHSDFIPAALTRISAQSPREQLMAYLAGRGLPVLDLTPVLREAAQRAPVFYKTDTHWNSYGSLVASRSIMKALGLPTENEQDFDPKTVTIPGGDLAGMLNMRRELREETTVFVPRRPRRGNPQPVSKKDMCNVEGGVDDPALPRAVVYRDSFTGSLIPFLTEHFSWVSYIWARNGAKMKNVPAAKPQIVLQIMADRALRLELKYSVEIQREQNRIRSVELQGDVR